MPPEPGNVTEDPRPVSADIPPAPPLAKHSASSRPTRAGRVFGGLLAFLSLWQTLNPEHRIEILVGLAGLAVSVLWFVSCPRLIRLLATAALVVLIVVLMRAPTA